jgi:hypothetical protein
LIRVVWLENSFASLNSTETVPLLIPPIFLLPIIIGPYFFESGVDSRKGLRILGKGISVGIGGIPGIGSAGIGEAIVIVRPARCRIDIVATGLLGCRVIVGADIIAVLVRDRFILLLLKVPIVRLANVVPIRGSHIPPALRFLSILLLGAEGGGAIYFQRASAPNVIGSYLSLTRDDVADLDPLREIT